MADLKGKILLTGSTGFVGRHLAPHLSGFDLRLISRVQPQCPDADVHIVQDLCAVNDWQALLQDVDVVVHLAAKVHDASCHDHSVYQRENLDLVKAMAEAAVEEGVKRFVFLSSVKVVGEQTGSSPLSEQSPHAPSDAYSASKSAAERFLLGLAETTDLEVVIIRPPLVYGPGVKANFKALMHLADSPWPLPFAGVNNRRDMVSVFNLCDLIVSCVSAPAAANQALMVSDGEAYSLAGLLAVMRETCGRPRRLFYVPVGLMRLGLALLGKRHIAERLFGDLEVDISETRRVLNWQPKVSLRATLEKM